MEVSAVGRSLVVVHNTQCNNSCSYCYYGLRHKPASEPDITWMLDLLYDNRSSYDDICVGINNGAAAEEFMIVDAAIAMLKPYNIMVPGNVVCNADRLKHALANAATVSVSIGHGRFMNSKLTSLLSSMRKPSQVIIASITSSDFMADPRMISEHINGSPVVFSAVHLICTKPDMAANTIRHLVPGYMDAYAGAVELMRYPVMIDACIPLSDYLPLCMSNTFEINSSGEVRLCPYASKPHHVIDKAASNAVDGLAPFTYRPCSIA